MREEARRRARVHWRKARTLVGKLANLAQVLPELKASLRGGYAVAQPPRGGTAGGWRRGDDWAALRPESAAAREWIELLYSAAELVGANDGVPLAPQAAFPGPDDEGVVTVTTDASGVDGVGGYAFLAGRKAEVLVVSDTCWPPDVQDVPTRVAATRKEGEAERQRD
eukprot:1859935-Pleurochrysis_carterae.AAC.1